MLICNECKRLISEDLLEKDITTHESDYNCECGGYFETAIKCRCCEEYTLEENCYAGWRYDTVICSECLNYFKDKYKRIYNQLCVYGCEDFIDWLVDREEIPE